MLTFRYVCQSFFPIKHPQHYDQWQLFNRERRMGRMRRRHGACLLAFLCPAHSSVPGRDMCSLYTYTRVGMRGRGWEARKPTRRFPPRKEKKRREEKRGRRGLIPRTYFVCCCICNLPLWFTGGNTVDDLKEMVITFLSKKKVSERFPYLYKEWACILKWAQGGLMLNFL